MKTRFTLLIFLLLASASAHLARALDAPTGDVKKLETTWRDQSRRRDVPVKVFYPAIDQGPFPLVILSHGLGGSRDGLDYLGRFWASHGYVCAQIQHIGSDDAVWRGAKTEEEGRAALSRAAGNIINILNRPRDVSFAIDQMLALNADAQSALNGKIDPDEIGVAGHSLGAFTALASAGQKLISGMGELDLSDPRLRACVAMSSPLNPQAPLSQQFAPYKLPTFYIVGAQDKEVLGATIAQRQIYDAINAPDQYLLILGGADHMTFAGQRFGDELPRDEQDHALTQAATLAFLDATLKGKATAEDWLHNDLSKQLPDGSTFEAK